MLNIKSAMPFIKNEKYQPALLLLLINILKQIEESSKYL